MTPLRVASYNIRKAIGTDRNRKPRRICEVIRQTGAELVLLQEADLRLHPRPPALDRGEIEQITGLTAVPLPDGRRSLGHHGNAVLVAPGHAVEEVEPVDLPGLEPRGALSVTVDAGAGPVRLVAVHLGLRRADRRRQLTALLTFLETRPDIPTLIGGDMNEWSHRVGLGRLHRHYEILAPGRSFHSRVPMAALDRFAIGDGLSVVTAGVEDGKLARIASDHLPVWADLARTEGTGAP